MIQKVQYPRIPIHGEQLGTLLEEACGRLMRVPTEDMTDTPYQTALAWVEKPLIIEALKLTGGNRAKAAEHLGIHRNTLRTKLKTLEIS